MLKNCSITVEDIVRAGKIYGKPVHLLKWKMTRKPQRSKEIVVNPLPLDISNEHKYVKLLMDILFIKKISFLLVKSEGLEYLSIYRLRNRTKSLISPRSLPI